MLTIESATPHRITFKVNRSCRWCWKTTKTGDVCRKCQDWLDDPARIERWWNQRYSRVQVLNAGAADLVRSTFSETAIRDDFEFLCSEPEQMYFGVWRAQSRSFVQRKNGQWVHLFKHFDVFVSFTLVATSTEWFKKHEKRATQFWRGVGKLARKHRT